MLNMANFIMLFVCLAAGMLLRSTNRVPQEAHTGLNGYIVHVALPALVLNYIHAVHLSADLLWTAFMPWLLFGLSAATFLDRKSVV